MPGDGHAVGTCTACNRDCTATFICHVCHERKNLCHHKKGGFEAREPICDSCDLTRETGMTDRELRRLALNYRSRRCA